MSSNKYAKFENARAVKERPWQVHPIWRGIGCIMLIVIPIMAYLGGGILIEQGVIGAIGVPFPEDFLYPLIDTPILGFYISKLILLVAVSLTLIGFAALMIIYAVMYSALGPARYGPLDVEPIHYKPKKKLKKMR